MLRKLTDRVDALDSAKGIEDMPDLAAIEAELAELEAEEERRLAALTPSERRAKLERDLDEALRNASGFDPADGLDEWDERQTAVEIARERLAREGSPTT